MDLHGKRLLCLNKAMRTLTHLPGLLGCHIDFKVKGRPADYDGVLVWGKKPSAKRGEAFADKHQLPIVRVEDGFLRSVGLGPDDPPLSVCIDDLGIYYDANAPSRLEALIAEPLSTEEKQRAQQLIQAWRDARVSKYNQGREWGAQALVEQGRYVLLIDQTFGDASIEYGAADASVFIQALEDAIAAYPDHRVIVKTHPDVVAGRKRGHFSAVPAHLLGQFELLGDPIHLPALLEHAEAVYCVTSQAGFEALLWGKPVHVYGMPFYAGWGLTTDIQSAPARRATDKVTLEQLAFAALVRYPRYWHPERREPCEVEVLLSWMGLQRQMIERFAPQLDAVRWSRWKRPVLRRFLAGSRLQFIRDADAAERPTVGWGARATTDIRVEDGFIRSVGLGADLTMPQSWVFDDIGMYYDATRPSRLEKIISETEFNHAMRSRGEAIGALLLANRVTKYNVGEANWSKPLTKKRIVLVPGQVESDLSIKLGSPHIKSNLELLRAVRKNCPNDYIVYKPHPDVQAGLRVAGEDQNLAHTVCDEIVLNQDMAWLLNEVDEIHTITSLTGFEALLRGLPVTCYGQPFYSGWGVTTDVYPQERRQRQIEVSELIFATLVLYPHYLNHDTGRFTTPEFVIKQISDARRYELRREVSGFGKLRLLARLIKRKLLSLKRF